MNRYPGFDGFIILAREIETCLLYVFCLIIFVSAHWRLRFSRQLCSLQLQKITSVTFMKVRSSVLLIWTIIRLK